MEDTTKIRKRGCSPSSFSSSIIQNYRFKRAVLVRKRGCGSITPVPSWRIMASRSPSIALRADAATAAENPRSQLGESSRVTQPVSARKLAATLWELNEVPTPRAAAAADARSVGGGRRRREKVGRGVNLVSGSLPPHLSDPSHSPVSEGSDRSGISSRRIRQSLVGRRLSVAAQDVGVLDDVSDASFMEIETRSRCQAPSESTMGSRNRLKDVSNALTTSKELLKIISRLCVQGDHHHHLPSSSMSVISALHAELKQARLLVKQSIQEQSSDQSEVNSLLKQFARARASWKNKQREAIEAAIESVVRELEVERKLRRRVDNLNKKLGKELAETKACLSKAVKELESVKRLRGEMERLCDELAWKIGEDKVEAEGFERESLRRKDETEREGEMLQVADVLGEERAHMIISQMKHRFKEKNVPVDQSRDELQAFLRTGRSKEKAHYHASVNHARLGFSRDEEKQYDAGEVEDGGDGGEESVGSDLRLIELNKAGYWRNSKSGVYASPGTPRNSKQLVVGEVEENNRRKSIYSAGKDQRRDTSLIRSESSAVDWGSHHRSSPQPAFDFDRISHLEKLANRRSCGDHDLQRYTSVKYLWGQILSSCRNRDTASPARKWA